MFKMEATTGEISCFFSSSAEAGFLAGVVDILASTLAYCKISTGASSSDSINKSSVGLLYSSIILAGADEE